MLIEYLIKWLFGVGCRICHQNTFYKRDENSHWSMHSWWIDSHADVRSDQMTSGNKRSRIHQQSSLYTKLSMHVRNRKEELLWKGQHYQFVKLWEVVWSRRKSQFLIWTAVWLSSALPFDATKDQKLEGAILGIKPYQKRVID